MTSFSLRQISKSVYEITSNRRKVGFVRAVEDGYVAQIGEHRAKTGNAKAAFRQVATQALGFRSERDLAAHNAEARQRKAELRAKFNEAMDANVRGDFGPMLDLLSKKI